tara:strand:- start:268 stop:3513 length:3246 start_codon:yes stop_codon:yes gene_type:complete
MATEIKLRRGTKAQHDDGSGFTGALGEVTVDTTDDTLRVHDGSLKGGHVIAKLSDVEASDTLSEMSDVNLTSPADGSLLKYDNASSKWIDSAKLTETATGIDVTGTVTADDQIIITSNDSQDAAQPRLILRSNENASIDNQLGEIAFQGHNNQQHDQSYVFIRAESPVTTDDQEEGKLKFFVRKTGNAYANSLSVDSSGIDVTGTVTADGVKLGDSEKIQLGDLNDLEIYHNGSHSVIDVTGTGNLILTGSTVEVKNSDNNVKIVSEDGATGAIKLSHGNTQGEQLATTATGINVTGELTTDSIRMGTDQAITFNTDNSNYSQLKRTAAGNTFLQEVGSGEMIIQGENLSLRNTASAVMYKHDANAAELYHRNGDNAGIKLQTTNTGIDVTGTVTADGLTLGAGEIATFNSHDGAYLEISGSATGSFSLIEQTGGGDLFIQGENGFLRNDAGNALVSWYADHPELSWQGTTGAGIKLATTAAGIDVTGAVKSTKGFYTDYKNHGDFPTTDSWYTIAICKGRDAVTTIQRASGEFIVVDNTDAAGHETVRFTASELFAQDALISVSEYLSYSAASINRFRIKSGNAFEGSALQVYASATTADLGVTLINDPYLQSNEGGWHLLDAPVIDSSDPSTGTGTDRTLGFTVGNDVNARAWDWTNFTPKADTGHLNNTTGLTTTSGVSVGGNLDVTGAINVSGTVDGRDIATDGTKLDAIESSADVTDTANVVAALTAGNNIAIAGNGTISSTDTNTQYSGGTGLTLSGTTFNVDAAQTGITSLGTLIGLTTGATTVNGPLIATNDYHQFKSTNTSENTMPLIEVFRDKEITGNGQDPLGGFVFTGRNEDDRKVSYASFYCNSTGQNDDGEQTASLVFTVADGSGAVDPFTDYTNGSFQSGHSVALNIGAEYFITTGYLRSDAGELKLGSRQAILESPDATNDQGSYKLYMPNAAKAKVMQIGGMGPLDTFIGSNQSVVQMLQYRGQHMVSSGGPFEFELPACVASSTISTSTANVGDIWQITNIYGSAITIDRDGSGTAQSVYYLPSLTLSVFTNNPTLAVGGTMTLQAVAANVWLIINYTGLTDA